MHDVQVQIRCQRCGNQMELKDPGPDDPWPPQQFWECPACGRHFWTTYPPPKKPAPPKAAPTAKAGPDATATGSKTAAGGTATPAESSAPAQAKPTPEPPSDQPSKTASGTS